MNCEEKDLIVISDNKTSNYFPSRKLQRCVKSIFSNMAEGDEDLATIDALCIAKRMESLYHHDFTSRLNEIQKCLSSAQKSYKSALNSSKQICPGLRQLDIETLDHGNWLNDVIINNYLNLLVKAQPSACALSSFFIEELQRNNKHALPKDWFKRKYVLIPVCLCDHWSLLCAIPSEMCVQIYNSIMVTSLDEDCCNTVKDYLQVRYNKELNRTSRWSISIIHSQTLQQNAYDCGVYVCMFARMILFGLSPYINPDHVTAFRKWMREELILSELRY